MADISQVNLPNDNNSPYNIKDASVPHSSLTAASGGTDLSLVTTGEKYNWNNISLNDLSDVVVTNPNTDDILQYSYENGSWKNTKLTDMLVSGVYPVGAVFQVDVRAIPSVSHITLSKLSYNALLDAPSNLPAASGGTDLSLVTTGEKYDWNSKSKITELCDVPGIIAPTNNNDAGKFLKFKRFRPDGITEWSLVWPKVYNATERQVGTWIEGDPIYERTVVLDSAKTIAAGNNSAAGAWTSVSTGWDDEIIVLDFQAYSYSGNDNTYWGHLTAQWNSTNKDIRVLNIRSQTFPIDAFTIRYYYK